MNTVNQLINAILSFDVLIPLAILLSMLLTKEPKRAAIGFIAIISVSQVPVDMMTGEIGFHAYAITVEFMAGLLLVFAANTFKGQDKFFYRLMGCFMWCSAFVTYRYAFGYFEDIAGYQLLSYAIAITHVALMMVYTDGIQRLIRNLSNYMLHSRWSEAR